MAHLKSLRLLAAFGLAALLCLIYATCVTQAQTTSKASDQEKATDILVLSKVRADAAKEIYDGVMIGMSQTRGSGDDLVLLGKPEDAYIWSVRWLNAQRDMRSGRDNQVTALQEHLARMKALQKRVSTLDPQLPGISGRIPVRYYLAEAECWLAQEKAK